MKKQLDHFNRTFFLFASLAVFASVARADQSDTFFDDSYVHEIRLEFDDSNWYSTLYNSHANDSEDPYFPASFSCDGVTLDQIGVRMKGNSSFGINSIKKSLKLDFDEYDEDNSELSFLGLKKLNLNNSFKDPTLMREKLFLDFAGKFIPTIRCVFVRVYVNNSYLGLYSAVEQVDKNFIQDRFGSNEDGNLYKGAASDDASGPNSDFGSDLVWEGSDESSYHDHYQLKTNEDADDFSGLVAMINALNNEDPDTFPTSLEPLMDIENVLYGLAINNLFSNLDSYSGSAHNFYIYQSDSTNQFSHIFWDTNESFGTFAMFGGRSDMRTLDPFWTPSGESRPLMENLWANTTYSKQYLLYFAKMIREGFNAETMSARIDELAELIRTDVYADNNKSDSNAAFEQNLSSSYGNTYGLKDFIATRSTYLENLLAQYADVYDIHLNEIVLNNDSANLDSNGDSDPWIELYNGGLGSVSLSGLYLSDSIDAPTKWALPSVSLDDGAYYTIWMDGESSEGSDHANFQLSDSGGVLYLYNSNGTLIDLISYPAMTSNLSYQRFPDGDDNLIFSNLSTLGSSNQVSDASSVVLYINEIMAANTATLQDPFGGGYPDWFELYNPNAFSIDLSGMYLTDDITDPTQWEIPSGVQIEALSYLLFWADDDEEQGSTHTNFKLSASGEEIALFDTDANGNAPIDWVSFGEQSDDISYGRFPDGSSSFALLDSPTPAANNSGDQVSSYMGYTIQVSNGSEWIDSGDWLGWISVKTRPWVWSNDLSVWLYMNEDNLQSNGIWIWLMNESTSNDSGSSNDTYLQFARQYSNGESWIDTGSWIGWLGITNAPWVWSYSSNQWLYINSDDLTNSGLWIYASI